MSQNFDTGWPIGSYEKVVELGLDPREVASCSAPSADNAGCPYWKVCKFPFKGNTRFNGDSGPQLLGVASLNVSNKQASTKIRNCFNWMAIDRAYALGGPEAGRVSAVVGYQGDKVMIRETARLHPKPDPNCENCLNHRCFDRVEKEVETVIPRFPDPGVESSRENYNERVRELLRGKVTNEMVSPAIAKTQAQIELEESLGRSNNDHG